MTTPQPPASRRGERILAYMFIAMVGITVLAIVLLLCSAFLGNSGRFDEGIWPVVAITPLIALPFAFIMAVALFVVVIRRRRHEAAALSRARSAATTPARTAGARPPKSK